MFASHVAQDTTTSRHYTSVLSSGNTLVNYRVLPPIRSIYVSKQAELPQDSRNIDSFICHKGNSTKPSSK